MDKEMSRGNGAIQRIRGSKAKPLDVDGYIEAAPKAAQSLLRQLRAVIRSAAPQAKERISYGMPTYEQNGRLAYFAGYKSHVGLYAVVHEDSAIAKEAMECGKPKHAPLRGRQAIAGRTDHQGHYGTSEGEQGGSGSEPVSINRTKGGVRS